MDAGPLDYDYLRRCPLFGGVTEEAFAHIQPLFRRQSFARGETILAEGSINDRIYFIEHGKVRITKTTFAEGRSVERHIITMASGDTFGEMELIDIQPCAATVRAVEDTATLSLSNSDLYHLSKADMKTYALLIMNLARELSRRLRRTDLLLAQGESEDTGPDDSPPLSDHAPG